MLDEEMEVEKEQTEPRAGRGCGSEGANGLSGRVKNTVCCQAQKHWLGKKVFFLK
jgi:hypothetical protein